MIRHRRTHGSNTTTVAPDIFHSNDAATTLDGGGSGGGAGAGMHVPITPTRATAAPSRSRNSTSVSSVSHVSPPRAPTASMTDADYQSPLFDSRTLDFPPMGNSLFGHDVYPASELAPAAFHDGLPQIDPSLGEAAHLDAAGAHLNFSGSSYLDPALSAYPQDASMAGYPPLGLSHMPYVPPQVEQFPSWLVTPDFDLAAFNKKFLPPTAAEFLGANGPHANALQWKDHDMPSLEMPGAMVSLREHWGRDLIPSIDVLVRIPLTLRCRNQLTVQNIAIQLFFTGFNPIFPIFHAPTFHPDPADHSDLLLLSICSIGTLFMGSDDTTLQAAKMFETVHKAIQGNVSVLGLRRAGRCANE